MLTRWFVLCLALSLCGCNVYRGIPTHGGGKRFDEEQRAVVGAIRQAIAQMDLSELRGKRAQVIIDSISHDGGGVTQFPGLQDISVSGEYRKLLTDNARTLYREYGERPEEDVWRPYSSDDNEQESTELGASARYRPQFFYSPHRASSNADLNYLKAALTMKCLHNGIAVTGSKPDVVLHILTDVLGTNRSREDAIIVRTDTLAATCELTYYAQSTKTGELLFRARRAAARGVYREESALFLRSMHVSRKIEAVAPTLLPVDGEGDPSTWPKPGTPLDTTRVKPALSTDELRSQYVDSLVSSAELQIQAGDLDQAERALERVRAIDPNHPGLLENEERVDLLRD